MSAFRLRHLGFGLESGFPGRFGAQGVSFGLRSQGSGVEGLGI